MAALLPISADAVNGDLSLSRESAVTTLYVNNIAIVCEGAVTGDSAAGVTYDAASNTLTLNNAVITEGYAYSGSATAGIYAAGDLNLVCSGESVVGSDGYLLTHGVNIAGSLTISGSGTLTSYGANNGVVASNGSLTVEAGTLNCYGGKTGLRAENDLTINSGAVYAEGGLKDNGKFGILANRGLLKITNGTVTAKNTNADGGYGMKGTTGIVISGGIVTADGTTNDIFTESPNGIKIASDATVNADNISPSPLPLIGNCGDFVTWRLTPNTEAMDTFTLTISGTGAMEDYANSSSQPWNSQLSSITNIVVEQGVTTIGDYAFMGAGNAETVTMPEGLTKIGQRAFANCSALQTPDFPSTLTEIGANPFYRCNTFDNVVLPDNLTTMGEMLFYECTGLTSITIPAKAETLPEEFVKGCSNLKSIQIPANIKAIGQAAFSQTGLEEVTIPSTVETLGASLFHHCPNLKKVTFDGGVTIQSATFGECTNLKTIVFSANDFDVHVESNEYIFNDIAANCVVVLEGENIPQATVEHMKKSIHPAASVIIVAINGGALAEENWENEAPTKEAHFFFGWYANPDFTGDPVSSLAPGSVYYAKWALASGYCGGDDSAEAFTYTYKDKNGAAQTKTVYKNVEWRLVPNENEDTYTLKLTGSGKMADWTYVSGAIRTAVTDCPWSASVDKITAVDMPSGITFGNRAFQGLKALRSFTFPQGITEIPEYTFADCVSLENITIPEGVTSIGLAAFRACDTMTEIVFPDSVKTLGESVLRGCAGVKQVTFPQGITEIPASFFLEVTSLEEITLPATIEAIGKNAFSGCTSLRSVDLSETNIKILAAKLFSGNASLQQIILPNGLEAIGDEALKGTGITSIVIPEHVSSIGSNAFQDCTSLSSVVMHTAAFKDSEANESGEGEAYWQKIPSRIFSTIANNSVVYFVGDALPLAFTSGHVDVRINNTKTAMVVTNGGVFDGNSVFEAGQFTAPVKDGYVLDGWYENEDLTGTSAAQPTPGKVYYAKWVTCLHDGSTTYAYTAERDTLTQSCADCKHVFGTARVAAPEEGLVYDGSAKTAAVTLSEGWQGDAPEVTYWQEAAAVAGGPVNAGTYTAKITAGGVDAVAGLVIKKAAASITLTASDTTLTGEKVITLTAVVEGVLDGDTTTITLNGADGLTVADKGAGVFEVTIPAQTKTYSFTASVEGDNYEKATSAAVSVKVGRPSSGGSVVPVTYSITVPSGLENGSISVSPKQAGKGSLVTITATPEEGYELSRLTVTDQDGHEISLTEAGGGAYTFTMPGTGVVIDAAFAEIKTPEPSLPFDDVAETDWYYEAVKFVYDGGVVIGTADHTFSPGLTMTRDMGVTILYRLEKEPAVSGGNPFPDVVSGSYYEDAAKWGSANGIVKGYGDGGFGAGDPITREQFAAILYRYAIFKGLDVSVGEDTNILSYTDAGSVSEWAIPAMQWAVGSGVMQGDGAGGLNPGGTATRAEAAQMLMNFCSNVLK